MVPTALSPVVGPDVGLHDVIANRRWVRRSHPFPHVVARDVFSRDVYGALDGAFHAILGGDPTQTGRGLARTLGAYDASAVGFTPALVGPFRLFVSRAWHDVIARVMHVPATGDVDGGLHHHAPGSASGHVHNDFNPGWFATPQDANGIAVSDSQLCDYQTGHTDVPAIAARERVRAVAMLYYLANPPWSPGDGGETGLYARADAPVDAPDAVVPPLNNSLLLFECTPTSYHSFLTNRRRPRNSVVLWLHRTKEDAVARWGGERIVYWPASRAPAVGGGHEAP